MANTFDPKAFPFLSAFIPEEDVQLKAEEEHKRYLKQRALPQDESSIFDIGAYSLSPVSRQDQTLKDVPITPMDAEQSLGLSVSPPPMTPALSDKMMSLPSDGKASDALSNMRKYKAKSPLTNVAPALQATQDAQKELSLEDAELKLAQDKVNNNMLLANLLRSATTIGGAIGRPGKEVDQTAADNLAKQAETPIQQLKEERAQLDKKVEREAALESLKNTKEFTDPSSDISKIYREEAARIGVVVPEGATAKQIHQILPMIESRMKHQELMEMRRDVANKEKEAKEERLSDKKLLQQEKDILHAREAATSGGLKELFARQIKLEGAVRDFDKLSAGETGGYGDIAALFSVMKAAQGDESIIKEAEMKMGVKTGSLTDQMKNTMQRFIDGRQLQPNQKVQIKALLSAMRDQSKRNYLEAAKPILENAKRKNLPLNEIFTFATEDRQDPTATPTQTTQLDSNKALEELKRRQGK